MSKATITAQVLPSKPASGELNPVSHIAFLTIAGISTFAMKIGIKRSVYLYCMELIIPYLWVIGCVVLGYLPWWSLLVLVAIKPAYDNINRANSRLKGNSEAFAILDEASAKLQLMFSLLLIVSFVVSLVIAALVS